MNIVLQCDNQYHQILKRYLNLHFSKINYIQDLNFPKQTIYIKQICSISGQITRGISLMAISIHNLLNTTTVM